MSLQSQTDKNLDELRFPGARKTFSLWLSSPVLCTGVPKVDFIKLDIEGAERHALEGARRVIQKYRPTLAVALYHSLDDFTVLPALIDEIAPGYTFYLGHYTIHQEETILFASR